MEYKITRNGRELKRINCSEEFAADIAFQIGGDYAPVTREAASPPPRQRTSRKQQIIADIQRKIPQR